MPRLVATMSACARTPLGPKEKRKKNNAKFSGHYIRPRMHAQRSFTRTLFAPI